MLVKFYRSPKERCADFAAHFMAGVRAHGDIIEERGINFDPEELVNEDQDVAVVLGIKKKRLFQSLHTKGTPMVYIDKGYTREWTHRRVSIGDCQPSYLGFWSKPSDRRDKFGWCFKGWRPGNHILLAWSSPGYHLYSGFPPPEEYAEQIVREIRRHTQRPIIYRPKPNQRRQTVRGATLSTEGTKVEQDLTNCHCMLTVGSSVCLQAVQMGVPSIILGDAIGYTISSTNTDKINAPYLAPAERVNQWLNDLAYSQWSLDEYASGEAWKHIKAKVNDNAESIHQSGK